MAVVAKTGSPSNPAVREVIKELVITFFAGFLLFIAFALLRDRERNAAREGPASTVYGEF